MNGPFGRRVRGVMLVLNSIWLLMLGLSMAFGQPWRKLAIIPVVPLLVLYYFEYRAKKDADDRAGRINLHT
jgi:hypothetical protein